MVDPKVVNEWMSKADEDFNFAYIDTRYPVHWPTDYTHEKAIKAREAAEKIGKEIKNLLRKYG